MNHTVDGANDARDFRLRTPANGFSFFTPQKNQKNVSPAIKTLGLFTNDLLKTKCPPRAGTKKIAIF
jgi:hypothetical protein